MVPGAMVTVNYTVMTGADGFKKCTSNDTYYEVVQTAIEQVTVEIGSILTVLTDLVGRASENLNKNSKSESGRQEISINTSGLTEISI